MRFRKNSIANIISIPQVKAKKTEIVVVLVKKKKKEGNIYIPERGRISSNEEL